MTDERDDSPRPDGEMNDDTAILPDRKPDKSPPLPAPVPAGQDEDTLIERLPREDDPSEAETRTDLRRVSLTEPEPSDPDPAANAAVPVEELITDDDAPSEVAPAVSTAEMVEVRPVWTEYAPPPLYDDYTPEGDTDVEAALAAVASLGTLNDLDQADTYAADPFGAVEPREDRIISRPAVNAPYTPGIALPPMRKLKRGSLASIFPALTLIGVGTWLLYVTTTGGTPDPMLLAGIGAAALALSLFAYWIGNGRWSRGALFAAALVVLTSGLVIVAMPPPGITLNTGISLLTAYPLIVAAIGAALLIGGALSRPSTRAAVAPGIVLLMAGIAGFLVTSGALSQSLLDTVAPLWFVPIVILVIVWLLPVIARMRGRG